MNDAEMDDIDYKVATQVLGMDWDKRFKVPMQNGGYPFGVLKPFQPSRNLEHTAKLLDVLSENGWLFDLRQLPPDSDSPSKWVCEGVKAPKTVTAPPTPRLLRAKETISLAVIEELELWVAAQSPLPAPLSPLPAPLSHGSDLVPPEEIVIEPARWWQMTKEEQVRWWQDYDFVVCLNYNPSDCALLSDLRDVYLIKRGERGRAEWIWVVSTHDDMYYRVIGGCDYTGWDCKSYADWQPIWEGAAKKNVMDAGLVWREPATKPAY